MPAYMAKAQRTDWATPKWLYEKLDAEFHFTLDPCHLKSDTMDGLIIPWAPEVAFANPPYGRPLKRWVAKAYNESQRGATVVMLLPARTDTAWFHDYCLKAEVRFIRGRLKFGDGKNSAPFPSMVVVFRPTYHVRGRGWKGKVLLRSPEPFSDGGDRKGLLAWLPSPSGERWWGVDLTPPQLNSAPCHPLNTRGVRKTARTNVC